MTVYKAMKHQTASQKAMSKTAVFFDMSDPGTGKTFTQIKAYAKRRQKHHGLCALVLAPKSLLRSAWEDDFNKFEPTIVCSVAYAENREEAFAAAADVYITNCDAVTWLVKQKPAFFKKFDTLIIDEISYFKHHTSDRSKALNKIRKYFKYRSGLSGTPNSNTILDIWNPVQILDDGKRLGTSFYGFRSATCSPEQVGPKADMLKWTDKEGAEDVIFGLIADITIRHKFEDCIDIPETHMYTMAYHLTPKQKKAYLEMEKTQIATLTDMSDRVAYSSARLRGAPLPMTNVTAINAAAVTTKLLQIASGAVYEHTDKYHVVDTGRYELIMDLVQDRHHPLVFFLWKHQRDQLVALAEKRGLKYCVLDGNATDSERTLMVKHYQAGFFDVMFAHPMSAAHGLTLTRGSTTIWASPTYNLEHFNQGNKRQARAGQKNKTEIIVILAEGTIEAKVYKRLLEKGQKMANLLSLFTEEAA